MSYQIYKALHFLALITIVFSLAINTVLPTPNRSIKILGMTASLILFVAGMGLFARLGFSHGGAWPLWFKLKISLWCLLAIGTPIAMKRAPQRRPQIFAGSLFLLTCAVCVAVFKPL